MIHFLHLFPAFLDIELKLVGMHIGVSRTGTAVTSQRAVQAVYEKRVSSLVQLIL